MIKKSCNIDFLFRLGCIVSFSILVNNCSHIERNNETTVYAVNKKVKALSTKIVARPINLEELLQQQAIIENITDFLKDEIKSGKAEALAQNAEKRLNVKFNFIENKPAGEGNNLTDFLINSTPDENGRPYEGGRVDVYGGGTIPGSMYSIHYEVYSEGLRSKYIDLIIRYEKSNGMVCLSTLEIVKFALNQGFEPNGGVNYGLLYTGFLKAVRGEIMSQWDDDVDRQYLIVRRYSANYPYVTEDNSSACAKKIGLRIMY